ncbi:MAG: TonB family protein [Phenylobacterium sp.]|uniref:TonB family protein n=1 Tax=Phenylobacterium sp. TaxID=1871053 RepID=UPI00122BEA29|nr:TonB family protein [Phenylobacterium sp.]TAJ71703.1 MAG: TonB family protein [Phenylobacterium sp.]
MLHLIALAAAALSSASAIQAAPAPALATTALTEVRWVATPNGQDIANVYPPTAVQAGKSGAVLLECRVATQGGLEACNVQIEDPVGLEFGMAALELAPLFKMSGTAPDGSATAGRTIRIPIMFSIVSTGDR